MEMFNDVRFNRINYPKGATIVDAGTWTVGTISTGKKVRGKYESLSFIADAKVNTGINTKAKYNLVGYFENGKYGKQFKIHKMEMILDTKSAKGLEQALELIMTPLMAGRMIEHFKAPEAVIDAFENKYSIEFMKIKGMTEEKLDEYYKDYEEKISGQEAIMALTPLGFTPKQAKSIFKKYKDMEQIMEMLDNAGMYDFYLDGVLKFHEAETIGRAKDIDLLNEKRIAALIVAYYKKPFQEDSYFTDEQMNTFIVPYLIDNCGSGLNHKHLNSALSYLNFKKTTHRASNKTGLKFVHDTEVGIYQTIKTIRDSMKHKVTTATNVIENEINSAPFELSDEQSEAVRIACTNGVSIISGNAGAGKSTTLGIVTKIFTKLGYSIEQVALSGKAALRITETTGLEAKTIHRLFSANTKFNDEGFKNVPDINNPYADLSDVKLHCDVVILDEASMVGGAVMLNLLNLIEKSESVKHLVIVGDNAQLPPIGIGQAFTDLLSYGDLPKAKLTKVYRQASESGILAAATMIRQNQNFISSLNTFGADFSYKQRSKGAETIAEFDRMLANNNGDLIETQIIAMTNLDVTKINVAIQKHLKIFSDRYFKNKERGIEFTIYEGSKVMLSENQYTTLTADGEEGGDPVFNGNIGIVKKITDDYMLIDFAGIGEVGILKECWIALRLGYAITIHKSQGSGFNSVIAIVNDGVENMLTSNMMYTAITRAKKECTLISPDFVVNRCANKSADERQTWLPIFYGGKK